MSLLRTRWAAIGAAVAVTLGAGGIGLVSATTPTEAVTFVPITPCRLFDTRPEFQVGSRTSPLAAGDIHTVTATGANGDCTGIPSNATAVSMNMTSTDATAPTFLTVWAADAPQPETSSMNPVPGSPATPNGVIAALSGGGQFSIFNLAGSVHVFADINGYYVDHTHDDRYYTEAEVADILPFSVSDSRTDQVVLTDTLQTILSVPIQAKVAGQVIVNSATAVFHSVAGADVACFILPAGEEPAAFGTNIPGVQWFESEGPNSNDATISGTRAFNVAASSVTVIELRCAENGADGGRTFAAEMTAIFVPSASDL
jgi:hypothetical protein